MTAPNPHHTDAACLAQLLQHDGPVTGRAALLQWDWSPTALIRMHINGLLARDLFDNRSYYRLTPNGLAIAQAHEAAAQAVGGV